MGEVLGQYTQGRVSQCDDCQLNPNPADDEEGSNLKARTGMKQLDEEGSSEPHNDQTDEAAREDDEELSAVESADVAHSAWREGNGEGYSREDGVNSKGDISYLNLKYSEPEA